ARVGERRRTWGAPLAGRTRIRFRRPPPEGPLSRSAPASCWSPPVSHDRTGSPTPDPGSPTAGARPVAGALPPATGEVSRWSAMDANRELVEQGDLDELARHAGRLARVGDWPGLRDLRDRCWAA